MSAMYPPVLLKSAARTSVGKVRDNNEDSIHLWAADHFALAVVADGMGGAAAGEEASRMAVEAIEKGLVDSDNRTREFLQTLTDEFVTAKLREAVRAGNASIVRYAADNPELYGMGTTTTLAFVRYDQALLAHVGDSRAYLVQEQGGTITQVTADHSFVEALVAAGQITIEQAEEHPMRHVLYRALGQTEELDVDVYSVRLFAGDRLVLCSDGLTRHVRPQEIARIVLNNPDPGMACDRLIQLTNERGGEDNVSVIVIRLEAETDAGNLPKRDTASTGILGRVVVLDEDDTLEIKRKDLNDLEPADPDTL